MIFFPNSKCYWNYLAEYLENGLGQTEHLVGNWVLRKAEVFKQRTTGQSVNKSYFQLSLIFVA